MGGLVAMLSAVMHGGLAVAAGVDLWVLCCSESVVHACSRPNGAWKESMGTKEDVPA